MATAVEIPSLDQVLATVEKHEVPFSRTLLEIAWEEVEKVKASLPASYDATAQFLALARPITEACLLQAGYFPPNNPVGRPPYPAAAIMLLHVLCTQEACKSYRFLPDFVNSHPSWVRALQLKKAPSDSMLSKFRTKMGEDFFLHFFKALRGVLVAFGLFTPKQKMIIDTVPVVASANLARANASAKLDDRKLKQLFETIDLSPASALFPPETPHGKSSPYPRLAKMKFLLLEKLGGFLSRNSALLYLQRHPEVSRLVGFPDGQVPTQPTFTYFEKHNPPLSTWVAPLVEQLVTFFDAQGDYDEEDPLPFFFRQPARREGPG